MPTSARARLALAALALLPSCASLDAGSPGAPPPGPETYAELVERAAVEDGFEGTVLVAEDGEVVFQTSVGHVDEARAVPVLDDSRFGIASITKLVTSILVLQLVEEGRLTLDTPLAELLPDLDLPDADRLTPHHLLLHLSGFPRELETHYMQPLTASEWIAAFLVDYPDLEEREGFGSFSYANVDYVLLGLIVEALDGRSWRDAVRARILEPAGMSDAGFLALDPPPEGYAWSFSHDDEGMRRRDPVFWIENFHAAGCMYATARDLLALDQALRGPALLGEAGQALLATSYPEHGYAGHGVWVYRYPFVEPAPHLMERRGGILGSNSVLVRFLGADRTLVILSNNDRFDPDSFGDPDNLREALILAMVEAP